MITITTMIETVAMESMLLFKAERYMRSYSGSIKIPSKKDITETSNSHIVKGYTSVSLKKEYMKTLHTISRYVFERFKAPTMILEHVYAVADLHQMRFHRVHRECQSVVHYYVHHHIQTIWHACGRPPYSRPCARRRTIVQLLELLLDFVYENGSQKLRRHARSTRRMDRSQLDTPCTQYHSHRQLRTSLRLE